MVALVGLAAAPETGAPAANRAPFSVRIPAPAGAATLAAFAANGLFAGLSGLFLATTFNRASHALAGATLFIVFTAGVLSQLLTANLRASRVFALGTISMLIGLVLLVTSVRLSTPSLALFLVSGGLIGAGAGAVFKGTTGVVLDGTAPENRVAMTAELLIALFVGLSVPVIGAGVALDQVQARRTPCWGSRSSSVSVLPAPGGGCSCAGRRARRKSHDYGFPGCEPLLVSARCGFRFGRGVLLRNDR